MASLDEASPPEPQEAGVQRSSSLELEEEDKEELLDEELWRARKAEYEAQIVGLEEEQATLREDVLEDYLECGEQKELLVTDRHLLYCSARSLQAPRGWIAPFAAIEGIDVPARGTQVVVHCSDQRHFIEAVDEEHDRLRRRCRGGTRTGGS